MLSVFKLVSECKPKASKELALRPPRPEKLEALYYSLIMLL